MTRQMTPRPNTITNLLQTAQYYSLLTIQTHHIMGSNRMMYQSLRASGVHSRIRLTMIKPSHCMHAPSGGNVLALLLTLCSENKITPKSVNTCKENVSIKH